MTHNAPVAIVGMGCICSAGLTLEECMQTLYRGERHPAPPTCFAFDYPFSFPVFEIRKDFFPAAEFQNTTRLRTSRLALAATLQACADAGLSRDALQKTPSGVCIGTNVGSAMNNEAFYRKNPEGCDPFISPLERFLSSNPTCNVAAEFNIDGPCQTVVNACSAGSDALGIAASWINAGLCQAVIAGGADELYQVTYTGFKSLFIHDDAPCKPFDVDRKGLNLGEGAAMFLLMSNRLLHQMHLRPRGYVLGYGSASDAHHFTKPRPDGKGLEIAINEALATAAADPFEIAFINAHGTGTRDNDLIESVVLKEIFPGIPFLSTKGYTGHTLGASGAIEAAFTLACLENGRIPATIGCSVPDPELPATPVRAETTISGRVALSQTLAFGGSNAVLILGTGA
jgi:3-oxoacyl-[acyl-carrier-protein] synthase-1/3-oxoacyl-[acyl-carrier-protein] synthase II